MFCDIPHNWYRLQYGEFCPRPDLWRLTSPEKGVLNNPQDHRALASPDRINLPLASQKKSEPFWQDCLTNNMANTCCDLNLKSYHCVKPLCKCKSRRNMQVYCDAQNSERPCCYEEVPLILCQKCQEKPCKGRQHKCCHVHNCMKNLSLDQAVNCKSPCYKKCVETCIPCHNPQNHRKNKFLTVLLKKTNMSCQSHYSFGNMDEVCKSEIAFPTERNCYTCCCSTKKNVRKNILPEMICFPTSEGNHFKQVQCQDGQETIKPEKVTFKKCSPCCKCCFGENKLRSYEDESFRECDCDPVSPDAYRPQKMILENNREATCSCSETLQKIVNELIRTFDSKWLKSCKDVGINSINGEENEISFPLKKGKSELLIKQIKDTGNCCVIVLKESLLNIKAKPIEEDDAPVEEVGKTVFKSEKLYSDKKIGHNLTESPPISNNSALINIELIEALGDVYCRLVKETLLLSTDLMKCSCDCKRKGYSSTKTDSFRQEEPTKENKSRGSFLGKNKQ